jgi:hypothetical protein
VPEAPPVKDEPDASAIDVMISHGIDPARSTENLHRACEGAVVVMYASCVRVWHVAPRGGRRWRACGMCDVYAREARSAPRVERPSELSAPARAQRCAATHHVSR